MLLPFGCTQISPVHLFRNTWICCHLSFTSQISDSCTSSVFGCCHHISRDMTTIILIRFLTISYDLWLLFSFDDHHSVFFSKFIAATTHSFLIHHHISSLPVITRDTQKKSPKTSTIGGWNFNSQCLCFCVSSFLYKYLSTPQWAPAVVNRTYHDLSEVLSSYRLR